MPERLQIHEINKLTGRTVFFDANVFLDIFWPTARNQTSILYSRFLGNCLNNKVPIAIDFIVLSEVINRAFRIEFEKYKQKSNTAAHTYTFKQYRDSADGINTQKDVYEILTKCLINFSICGKEYTEEDILSFLTVDRLDFNDKGISSLCSSKGYILVTNDFDFSNQNIDIISANKKIC